MISFMRDTDVGGSKSQPNIFGTIRVIAAAIHSSSLT
jgi:hypothetical protein